MKVTLSLIFFSLSMFALSQQDPKTEVQKVVDRLFDGMRTGDSAMVRSVFHPTAKLRTSFVHSGSGNPVLHVDGIEGFIAAVGTPHDEIWDERISNLIFHIDDNLAQVWMNYSFFLNDHLEHCGVNSIQLVRLEGGWFITDIADTRRKAACLE